VSSVHAHAHGGADAPAWQRSELVDSFLRERQTLLPQLTTMEDLVRTLLRRHGRPVARFLDLGAGDGAMSELVLGCAPAAHAVLVDFSEPMLARAHARLGAGRHSWEAVRADLGSAAWTRALPAGPYDLAVSSFAIHHLSSARKAGLFAEAFAALAPGAMFVNIDVVTVQGPLAGLFDEQMRHNAIAAEHGRHGTRSDEQVAAEMVDDGSDDRPDSAPEQLRWLRDAGFSDVELHFKWAEGAVYGATRPAEGSN
jgi:tRNA (cmo5U34)-methyltransferase